MGWNSHVFPFDAAEGLDGEKILEDGDDADGDSVKEENGALHHLLHPLWERVEPCL